VIAFRAPGRVNLIGEHVDYAGGLVLPAALEAGITLAGEPREDGVIRLSSRGYGEDVSIRLQSRNEPTTGWGRYAHAVAAELLDAGVRLAGFEGTVEGDLPAGAGVSSSAALEVCLAGGLAAAAGSELAGMPLALLAQRAEHRAVGVPCGIMDQAASALATAEHALLLDCGTLEHRPVAFPPGLALVVIDTGVRRRLEDSAYADRRRELEAALGVLPAGAAQDDPERVLAAAAAAGVDGPPLRRLRHVASERTRVLATVQALEREPAPDLDALGSIFAEGHASLRDDFEVSIPELDRLVELAREEGAVAARMTGGGFGGAIVALAPLTGAAALGERVAERYASGSDLEPLVIVSRPAAGAGIVV
jgi:galactokinase